MNNPHYYPDIYYANHQPDEPYLPASCSLPVPNTPNTLWHPSPQHPSYSHSHSMGTLSSLNRPPLNTSNSACDIPVDVHIHHHLPSSTNNNYSPSNSPKKLNSHLPGTPQPPGKGPRRSRRTPTETELAAKCLLCESCSARFARKHDLDRHRRIHTLEAPYKCLGCNRTYRRSDARKRHWDVDPTCRNSHHLCSEHQLML